MQKVSFLVVGLVAVLLFATPASACENCGMYYDFQALKWCKFCEYSYCGYYDCVVRESFGIEYCDSVWEDEEGDTCFTEEGALSGRCRPRIQQPIAGEAPAAPPDLPQNDS